MIEEKPNGLRLQLPWPSPLLNPNKHVHWAVRNKPRKLQRDACFYLAKSTGVELDPNKTYRVDLVFCPPNRSPRDLDNLVASLKSGLDGMCRALGIDDRMIKPVPDWGPVIEGGKVEVTVMEIHENEPLYANRD